MFQRVQCNKSELEKSRGRLSLPSEKVRLSLVSQPNGRTAVSGYVTVWNVPSAITEKWGVLVFQKGTMVLPDYPVTMQYNHNSDFVLASEAAGSLTFAEDDYGLSVSGVLDDTYIDDYVVKKIQSNVIRGMSAGFFPLKERKEQRLITSADAEYNSEMVKFVGQKIMVTTYDKWIVDEITITGIPAFPQTSIKIVGMEEGNRKPNIEVEEYGRDIDGLDPLLSLGLN